MLYYLVFLGGVVFGSIVTQFLWWRKTSYGCLRIDRHDPQKDTYRIEIENLDKLRNKKSVFLKIDNDADLSQK